MFLHTGILMMFVYGAEIFKKNKRFEIYEIPLDIVDTSEKTVNKTQIKKKAISQKNKKQKDLVSSILYDENSIILKYRKSNKGEAKKYIKLCHVKIKIIELVKILFYITHQKKYPFIISPYSNYYSIFDFDIHKDYNLYRNFWNFSVLKILFFIFF